MIIFAWIYDNTLLPKSSIQLLLLLLLLLVVVVYIVYTWMILYIYCIIWTFAIYGQHCLTENVNLFANVYVTYFQTDWWVFSYAWAHKVPSRIQALRFIRNTRSVKLLQHTLAVTCLKVTPIFINHQTIWDKEYTCTRNLIPCKTC